MRRILQLKMKHLYYKKIDVEKIEDKKKYFFSSNTNSIKWYKRLIANIKKTQKNELQMRPNFLKSIWKKRKYDDEKVTINYLMIQTVSGLYE
jgi:hypothetical protein